MVQWLQQYTHWLHTQWPAGHVEKLPLVNPDGTTNVPGVYIVGDITGIPLLKLASDTGAKAVKHIAADSAFAKRDQNDTNVLDLVVIGGGVSGMAAALEAKKHQYHFEILEAGEPFSTIINFPKGKPIFTYPTDLKPEGDLQFTEKSTIKEGLVEELCNYMTDADIQPRIARAKQITKKGRLLEVELVDANGQTDSLKAHRVIIAIGRSGNYRKLNVPGEDLDKVYNRLYDPKDYCDKQVLVVGGGDSALEAAIAMATCGAKVTISYRKEQFNRPKPDNIDKLQQLIANPNASISIENPVSERVTTASGDFIAKPNHVGQLTLMMGSTIKQIEPTRVTLIDQNKQEQTIENDVVFSMIGREPPLDFFRRSNITINGEWRTRSYISFVLVLLAFTFIYHWKKEGVWLPIAEWWKKQGWFPHGMSNWWASFGDSFNTPANLLGTIKNSLDSPGFYYSLAYCIIMAIFGFRRIRRRQTPYVKRQTLSLITIQIIPLFLLPYILLPWMGHNGLFDSGVMQWFADQLFPRVDWDPNGRAYYHAFGFVLAWPLFIWNIFTAKPMTLWLIISFIQTFILIPLVVRRWGKGAYCGWICSCGGMAETLGDAHRHKMPHGPLWNRLNMIGQFFLGVVSLLLIMRIISWIAPGTWIDIGYNALLKGIPVFNYNYFVDLLFAGIIGFGFYFHFSGRVWCRFACPLAALMHIYARFSRFRIFSDKKKCISCNVCTSVCHQGIDIMNFANKGVPMSDPQCVRCSACVQMCPTGVLSFGTIDPTTDTPARVDQLPASAVQMAELRIGGKPAK